MLNLLLFVALTSQYSPGTMEQVIENRQNGNAWVSLPKSLPKTDGYLAVMDCGTLGDIWYAQNPIVGNWEKFVVVDCVMPAGTDGAIEWMERHRIFGEVDHETAERWDTVGRGINVVWANHNPGMSIER